MPIRLRDLSQGALLHVMVALMAGPMKAEQIARKTGKSRLTVQRALAALESELGLVTAVPDGRWPIWSLRDASQLQLPLPGLASDPTEGSSPTAANSSTGLMTQISSSRRSSSSSIVGPELKKLLPPMMMQMSSSAEGQATVNQLTRMGATPGQAQKAIAAALSRNESLADIGQRITSLATYAADHRTIRNPGQWALGYIATGCDLPEDARPAADYSGYRPYLATDEKEEGGEGGRE